MCLGLTAAMKAGIQTPTFYLSDDEQLLFVDDLILQQTDVVSVLKTLRR
jgi:hypothetical protein